MEKQSKSKDTNQLAGYIIGAATVDIPKERPPL
jgi:hypothetical protein